MKIKCEKTDGFQPITLILEIQSKKELNWLGTLFNCTPISDTAPFDTFIISEELEAKGADIGGTYHLCKKISEHCVIKGILFSEEKAT
jgi:hypothetical protein